MNDVADLILSALRAAGDKGLLIDELMTNLETNADQIESTIAQLTSEGLIMLKQEQEDKRYTLSSQVGDDVELGSLSDLDGCPCFHCLKIGKCGVRQPDSPIVCRELEDWMLSTESG
jgi:predicted transcriptional regulator